MVEGFANCVSAAHPEQTARVLTDAIDARLLQTTALTVATSDDASMIVADQPISAIAVAVALSYILKGSALDMRVTDESGMTGTDSFVGVGRAVSVNPASVRVFTGSATNPIEAGLVWCAVIVVTTALYASARFAHVAESALPVSGAANDLMRVVALANG